VIVPDINLLVHAYNSRSAVHADAHLAALAIEHQAELHSTEADFSRFSGCGGQVR
jgi:hypothetical protein